MHLEGELIAANVGCEGGVVGIFNAGEAIELAEEGEFGGLSNTRGVDISSWDWSLRR